MGKKDSTTLNKSMEGKVCVITGANSGLGLVTARALAARKAHVVMVCRSPERGEAARADILQSVPSASLDLLQADLSSQTAIRNAADEINVRYHRLDVLINNAGCHLKKRQTTIDGIEWQLAVNHLAVFLLTNLLLDKLKSSAPARIITVSSELHRIGKINPRNIQAKNGYSFNGYTQYGMTKRMNIMFTREIAKRLRGDRVVANCLHPGSVATNFGDYSPSTRRLVNLFSKSPEKGAETMIWLATDPLMSTTTGEYFKNCKIATPGPARATRDTEAQKQLWEMSAVLTRIPV